VGGFPDPGEIARTLLELRRKDPERAAQLAYQIAKGPYLDIRGFLEDPAWLGGAKIWPGVQRLLRLVHRPEIREAYIEVGKGGGKSTMSAAFLAYARGELKALGDPHAFFGLDPGRPIVLLNVSTSEGTARYGVFAKLKSFVKRVPYLAEGAEFFTTTIVWDRSPMFPDGRVMALCGHSRSEGLEGHDVFRGVLDEANKHRDTSGKSNARVLMEMIVSSAESRFPRHYKVLSISSSRSKEDHQRQVIEDIKRRGSPIPWESA